MTPPPRGSASGNKHSATGVEMLTYTGRYVPLDAFDTSHPDLRDIAFGLGGYRYGNQHPARVSISQHSLAVCELVRAYLPRADSRLYRAALLHDAAEAYTQDLVGAVKFLVREAEREAHMELDLSAAAFSSSFDILGDNIQAAIEERFNCAIPAWMHHVILRADKESCAYEMAIGGWAPVSVAPFTREILDAGCPSIYERNERETFKSFYHEARGLGCL